MSDYAQMLETGRTFVPVPVNTSVPAVTGGPKAGQELSVTNGNWNNTPSSYTYQWRSAGTAVQGANKNKFTPRAADVAKAVDCIVTARNLGGATAAPASNAITVT